MIFFITVWSALYDFVCLYVHAYCLKQLHLYLHNVLSYQMSRRPRVQNDTRDCSIMMTEGKLSGYSKNNRREVFGYT